MNSFHQQIQFKATNTQYRGRFAPSPSGPLHFGSLVAALGSYLQARSHHGLWFVRIEDIGKPREQPGSVDAILDGLAAFGMHWDQDPLADPIQTYRGCLVQSKRIERYQQVYRQLKQQSMLYTCHCTRKNIKKLGGIYSGACAELGHEFSDRAVRIKQHYPQGEFDDLLQGNVKVEKHLVDEDYIIKRTGGLFAYQLVVVIDDIDQGITQVVRGADIMELTPRQINLFNTFEVTPPSYLHLPLVMNPEGKKLSKQNHAPAIDCDNPRPELVKALTCLGLPTHQTKGLIENSVEDIIEWAIKNWDIRHIPAQLEQRF